MNIFKRMIDWATDKGNSFSKENDVYEDIISNMDDIESYMNYIISDNVLSDLFPGESLIIDFLSIDSVIEFQKKSMARAKNQAELDKIKREIRRLEIMKERLLKKIKNLILKSDSIDDINESNRKMNSIIYQNLILEALKSYAGMNVSKKWTVDELEELRNRISQRRTEIIPYLGEIEQLKRK